MAIAISNVVIATDSFATWVGKTNQIADVISTKALTANNSVGGANVSGNSQLIGIFNANTIAAGDALRGGTVSTSANLAITSNVVVTGATLNVASNAEFYGGYVYSNVAHFNVVGGLANVTSNVYVNSSNVTINAVATRIRGGFLSISSSIFANTSNVFVNAAIITIQGGNTTHTSNLAVENAVTYINATAFGVAGVSTVTGNTTLKANSSVDTLQLLGNSTVTTLAVTVNSMSFAGNATYANNVAVTGTVTVTGLTTLNGNVGAPTANLTTALNVGANVTANTTALKIGNSTVNAVVTQTGGLVIGSATVNTTVNSTAISTTGVLAAGNTTITGFVNSSSYGTFNGTVNATALNIGANVNVNTTAIAIGNTTGNVSISQGGIVVGNSTVGTVNAFALNIGANVNLTTSRFNVGNTTVNTFITSTAIETDGTLTVLGAATLSNTLSVAGTLGSGNTTVTGFANVSSTLNVVGATTVNGALTVNNTAAVGNTTVTGFANVSLTLNVVGAATVNGALTVNNTAAVGNTTITGFVTATTYGTFGGTVNAAALNIGANVNVTTTTIAIGNTISNVSIDQSDFTFNSAFGTAILGSTTSSPVSFNSSTGVNGATEVITTSTSHGFVNGDYVLYSVAAGNTAVSGLSSGSYYFVVGANTTTGLQLASTLNGSAINLTAGVNETGHSLTRYSIVLNVGANSTVNTTAHFVGNSTTNAIMTSTLLALGNSTVNTSINSTSYAVGNSTVNTTINSTAVAVGGTLATGGNTTLQNTVTFVVVANSNIGNANTSVGDPAAFSNVELFSFPFATAAAAKLTGVITNITSSCTQIQEMILSHNSVDATLTVYGTVATPAANLGSFSSQINSTHVAVSLKQRSANSNVRLFVQLIK